MKALLIAPPFYRLLGLYNRYFPYGLLCIATAVRDAGHDVRLLDADFNEAPDSADFYGMADRYPRYLEALQRMDHPAWAEIERAVRDFAPDLVGIGAYTDYFASVLRVAEIVRKASPRTRIALGGPHVRVAAEEAFANCPEADFFIRGEGEPALTSLLDAMSAGNFHPGQVAGLSWRDGSDLRHNLPRPPSGECPEGRGPDRTLLRLGGTYTGEDLGLVMTSRGCPYNCGFCATETRRVRYRPLEDVVAEMRLVRERFGTAQFALKDDSFAIHRKRVQEFCDRLDTDRLRVGWECNTRVNGVDAELLRRMRRSGCNFIKVGIESGSDRVLANMNKRITVREIREAAAVLRRSGIHWTGYFMMGLPGETADDVAATLDILRETRPHVAVLGVYQPYPGTALFEEGIRRGLVKPVMTRQDYFSTEPIHYYKKDPAVQTDGMEPAAFLALEKQVKAVFHAHNKNLFRAAKMGLARMRLYRSAPGELFSDLKKFFRY